jgi:hypothetical protein
MTENELNELERAHRAIRAAKRHIVPAPGTPLPTEQQVAVEELYDALTILENLAAGGDAGAISPFALRRQQRMEAGAVALIEVEAATGRQTVLSISCLGCGAAVKPGYICPGCKTPNPNR